MFWNDLVRRWRKESRAISPRLLRSAGGHVAVLPHPQGTRQVRPLLVVLAVLALLLVVMFGSGRAGVVENTTEPNPPASVLTGA